MPGYNVTVFHTWNSGDICDINCSLPLCLHLFPAFPQAAIFVNSRAVSEQKCIFLSISSEPSSVTSQVEIRVEVML
jgi:hypothetical protein